MSDPTPIDRRIADASDRADEVSAFLELRLYEFNALTTGFRDGQSFCFTVPGEYGAILGGVAGYTWGGSGHIRELWVDEAHRARGLGTALVRAAEREATRRGCRRMILTTHSFQAPRFYAALGYAEVTRIDDDPEGHANIVMAKRLP